MKPYPKLKTKRLILRGFSKSDGPIVSLLAGDYELAKTTLNIPHPYETHMADEWIDTHQGDYEEGKGLVFAMLKPGYSDLVGAIGLTMNQRFNRAELGYWVGKAHWGRGYASESSEAMIRFGFEKLKLNKITASHMTSNPASGRVMQKVGMKHEGLLRQHVLKWDQFLDLAVYGILASDWHLDQTPK